MGRGLSALQEKILDEARSAERGFVLYEELLASLWPAPLDVAIATLAGNRDAENALLGIYVARYQGLNWQKLKELLKSSSSEEEQAIYPALIALETAEKCRPSQEASLSRAIGRLDERGLVVRLDVGHKDEHGKWIGHTKRGIRITVK